MKRVEAEAIFGAGRETCVEFMLEMAQRFEELAGHSERELVGFRRVSSGSKRS
jgi:hypothetical protein